MWIKSVRSRECKIYSELCEKLCSQSRHYKHGIALAGRKTTGPPLRVAPLMSYVAYATVTDDDDALC